MGGNQPIEALFNWRWSLVRRLPVAYSRQGSMAKVIESDKITFAPKDSTAIASALQTVARHGGWHRAGNALARREVS